MDPQRREAFLPFFTTECTVVVHSRPTLTARMFEKIKCRDVPYRQGFVEVANVHPGCVNIEVWNVHPDKDISGEESLESSAYTDADVIANTEIELSLEQAERLVQLLQAAIARSPERSGDASNMPIDTDPQQQEAASPQSVAVRSSSRCWLLGVKRRHRPRTLQSPCAAKTQTRIARACCPTGFNPVDPASCCSLFSSERCHHTHSV